MLSERGWDSQKNLLSTNGMSRQISKDPQHAIGAVLGTMAEGNGVLKTLSKTGRIGGFLVVDFLANPAKYITVRAARTHFLPELVSGFGSGGVLENLAYGGSCLSKLSGDAST